MGTKDSYTVVFEGSPRDINGNPFHVASEFGRVLAIGHGNAFNEADIFRNALEAIEDGLCADPVDTARAALDIVDADALAILKPGGTS